MNARSTSLPFGLGLLLVLPALAVIAAPTTPTDPARELLSRHGSIVVKDAGPFVNLGTPQIQVSTKLGRPAAKLADGSWLYPNYEVDASSAIGTLVVRFDAGRVSELRLVTPAVATTMITAKKVPATLVAANQR